MKKSQYPAALKTPIVPPAIGLLASDEEIQDAAKNIVAERFRKMQMLFDAHRVPYGDWASLCFRLAESHLAGFSVAKAPSGRKKKWDEITKAELVIAVEETGLENVVSATKLLAAQEPWRSKVTCAERLRDQYNRADPHWVEILKLSKLGEAQEAQRKPSE